MRDTATYHFQTRQAARDFVAACDELDIPAAEPSMHKPGSPRIVQVLLAHIRHNRDYLDGLAGSSPVVEVGCCPFKRIAEQSLGDARTLAQCFIAANEPSQLWSCIRFARRIELLPEGCYIGGAFFGPANLRFCDHSGEFVNDSFDEFREAAYAFLGWRDDDDDEQAAEYHDMAADGGML